MLVHSKELLLTAKKKKFAIPATNFIDLDSARTYVDTAEKEKKPLILAFAQSHSTIISLEEAALIGKYLATKSIEPVVLHLDHGADKTFIFKAIELGFTSVMIDASEKSFEENVALTKEVVDFAHRYDVTVEAELGHVGANANFENHNEQASIYTEAKDVLSFVEQTAVDSLAISIGTAHGAYQGTPKINFERLHEINELTDVPLVLHGGSSSGDSNLEKCALNGISKINIFTDFLLGAYEEIKQDKPEDYLGVKIAANQGMAKVLAHYLSVFHTGTIA